MIGMREKLSNTKEVFTQIYIWCSSVSSKYTQDSYILRVPSVEATGGASKEYDIGLIISGWINATPWSIIVVTTIRVSVKVG